MAVQIQLRNDTSAEWEIANPILAVGELGIETDTDKFKLGNGINTWNDLPYGGLQGEEGPQGEAGEDALWNFTGAYEIGNAYAVGDVATYEGQTWYRTDSNGGNLGDTPTEGTFWTLLVEKGDQGDQGEQGIEGPEGPAGKFTVSETPPESPETGDVWYNSINGRQFVYYDNYWVESTTAIVGQTGGTSGIIDGGDATSVYEV
jgi:hypothetical protein